MSIGRNTVINISGSLLPTLISLATVPVYLRLIGDARYGVIALVWLFIGYFGLFDFGLSRATANQIAKLNDRAPQEREEVFWTAIILNGIFGLVGGAILFGAAEIAFTSLFKIPAELEPELRAVLPWIGFAVPIATVSGVMVGCLEGRSKFATVNIIQVITTILTQVIPLAAASAGLKRLEWLLPITIATRALSSIPLVLAVIKHIPLRRFRLPERRLLKGLFGYGAWITVSNVVGPILETTDRLVIGSTLGVQYVTYYTIPYNLSTKVIILPSALSRTLFPVLSFQNHQEGKRIAMQSSRGLCALLTPVVILGILIMHPFLTLWLGAEAASRSFAVGEIVLLGAWMNSLSYLPYTQLQGQGRPDITAKFHVIELLPFIGILWVGMHYFGLIGAAMAWTLRTGVDLVLLLAAAKYSRGVIRTFVIGLALIAGSCVIALLRPLPDVIGIVLGVVVLAGSTVWSLSLDSPIRDFADKLVPRLVKWIPRRSTDS